MKKFALILLVLVPLLWASFASPQTARGATITVGTLTDKADGVGACSLREAIQNANDDAATFANCVAGTGADIITFSVSGTITFTVGSSIFVTDGDPGEGLIIDGDNNIVLDGGGSPTGTRLFDVTGVLTLREITIQNGYNSGSGGAISSSSTSDLTILNTRIVGNISDNDGGALLIAGALTVTDSVFQNNTADGNGGAIHFSSASPMNITNVAFVNNSAGNDSGNIDGSGGAIWHNGATSGPSDITSSYFFNNQVLNATSADGGGAIYHGTTGILAITGSAFFGNNVDGTDARGGAVFNNSGDDFAMTIQYSAFGELLGVALPTIPAIVIPGTDFDVVGAIGASGAGNTVTGTSTATAGGGAIFNNGKLLLNGSSFVANTSSNHGGAFMNIELTGDPFPQSLGQQVIISNSTFTLNTATNNGGAIYHGNSFVPNDNLMELRNVTISDNTAASGDGIFNLGDGESAGVSDFDDLYLVNTIIEADSCAGGSLGNGNLSASGNNVVFGGTCDIRQQDGGNSSATFITADPLLSAPELAFSLPPSPSLFTVVLSLGNGSSASGAGDNTICNNFPVLALDQRGAIGFRPQGAPACDIGAYESPQPPPPAEINVRDGGDFIDILDGDNSPNPADGTNFGTTPVGTPIANNFIIQNLGGQDLTLGVITVPAGFSITTAPTSPVAAGADTILGVTCDATIAGTYSGDISIPNNDSSENPYNFTITCLVEGPEINVRDASNSLAIDDGDVSPAVADGTDFGTTLQGSALTNTFTILNAGNLPLTITGAITTDNPAEFTVTQPALTTIGAGNTETFDVTCDGNTVGIHNATVTIPNDDNNENPYTFAITCEVTATGPQIEVFGNTQPIDDGGGNSPAFINDTDFGPVGVGTTQQRTFTIENNGTADLTISNPTLIVSGGGFTLVTPPPATIAAGDSATFVISCDTSAPASYIGGVTINNNSAAPSDVYNFALACPVTLADLRVSKTENTDPVDAGFTPLIYTVIIENTGTPNVDATNVVLTEVLPVGFTATNIVPSQGTCPATPLTGTFNCNLGTVGPGSTESVVITGSFDPSTPASTVTNEAYVNYTGFTTGSAGTAADGDDERATETTDISVNSDVSVTKTVDNPTPTDGDTILYTIVVENLGPSTATGVTLSDSLPIGVTGTSFTGAGCSFTAPTLSCPIGTLLPSATFTATITANVDPGASGLSQPITNTAIINSTSNDNNGSNDTDDVAITVSPVAPDIRILGNAVTITSGDISPDAADHTLFTATTVGTPSSRTFTIENNGTANLNITTATISNSPNPFTFTTAPAPSNITPGNSIIFVVQCNSATDGTFTETVTVNSNDPDTPAYTFDIECVVNPLPPDITVLGNSVIIVNGDITPDPADFTSMGTTPLGTSFTQNFTVRNDGGSALNFNGPTSVTLTGANAGEFTITVQPGVPSLAPTFATFFQVQCDATTAGIWTATVNIDTDDPDEDPFTFNVSCTVTGPEINLRNGANTLDIPTGTVANVTDGTDFGTTTLGTPVTRSFIIQNTGTADLSISVDPLPAGFTVVAPAPLTTIPAGTSTTLTIECTAAVAGLYAGIVTIPNNDSTGGENPYTFEIRCQVDDVAEINVQGNGVDIANGDISPSPADDTDFGSTLVGATLTNTFTIQNLGSQTLGITGTVIVADTTNFSIALQPAASINAGGNSTFEVTCLAIANGLYTTTVTIPNDDSDESPYTFDVSCDVGLPAPLIEVRGNGVVIPDGVIAPNAGDHTEFPITSPGSPVARTFTINNIGSGNLTVSISTVFGSPFTLTTAPTSPVATTTTFTITCNPAGLGTFPLTITIDNNDTTTANANPYTFGIECESVAAGAPEMDVFGNGIGIVSGDPLNPQLANHTDFGSTSVGTPISRTFTIENNGLGDLTLGAVTVPAGFSVTTAPTSPVTAGNSTTLIIACDAATQNTFTGTVSIVNNDSDENPYEFNVRCIVNAAGSPADLSLSKIVSDTTPQFGDILTYTVTVNNVGPGSTTNVEVVDTFPTSVTFLALGTVSQGTVTVDGSNLFLTWDIGTLVNPQTVTLTYTVQVNPTVGTTFNYAQITNSDAPDPNSDPGNGVPPTPIEDDEASIAFLFDPPFGDKAFVYDGVSVVTWTIIWVNPSNNPIVIQMNDPLLGGTTLVDGSLVCNPQGASTTTSCTHDPITNTIQYSGTIAPNPGATVADTFTASNRLIITYSVVVPDGVDSVANTATLTDLGSDVVVTVTETFTRTGTPPTQPPPTGGTPPLTREEIDAKVVALPATGEPSVWFDVLRIGFLMGVALTVWIIRRRRLAA